MARRIASPLPSNLPHSPHLISCTCNALTGCARACYALVTLGPPGEGAASAGWWSGVPAPGQWGGGNPPRLLRLSHDYSTERRARPDQSLRRDTECGEAYRMRSLAHIPSLFRDCQSKRLADGRPRPGRNHPQGTAINGQAYAHTGVARYMLPRRGQSQLHRLIRPR